MLADAQVMRATDSPSPNVLASSEETFVLRSVVSGVLLRHLVNLLPAAQTLVVGCDVLCSYFFSFAG